MDYEAISKAQLDSLLSKAPRRIENCSVAGEDLKLQTFRKASFLHCLFHDCSFNRYASQSDFRSTRFYKCTLSNVDFTATDLRGCIFIQCNLDCSDFTYAQLEGVIFNDCKIRGACFSSTSFGTYELHIPHGDGGIQFVDSQDTRFVDVDLNASIMCHCDLSNISLEQANGLDEVLFASCLFNRTRLPDYISKKRTITELLMNSVYGYNKAIYQRIIHLNNKYRHEYFARLTPSVDILGSLRLPFPISYIILFWSAEQLTEYNERYSSWSKLSRETCSLFKRAYFQMDSRTSTSRMAYREKCLEMKQSHMLTLHRFLSLIGYCLGLISVSLSIILIVAVLIINIPRQIYNTMRRKGETRKKVAFSDSVKEMQEAWVAVGGGILEKQKSGDPIVDLGGRDVFLTRLATFVRQVCNHVRDSPSKGILYTILLIIVITVILAKAGIQKGLDIVISLVACTVRSLTGSFWYCTCGFGEYPGRVLLSAIVSVIGIAYAFLCIGIPVYSESVVINTVYIQYSLPSNYTMSEFASGWLYAINYSLHCFSSLGFTGLGEESLFAMTLVASLSCAWGIFLSALLIWSIGRKMSSY